VSKQPSYKTRPSFVKLGNIEEMKAQEWARYIDGKGRKPKQAFPECRFNKRLVESKLAKIIQLLDKRFHPDLMNKVSNVFIRLKSHLSDENKETIK
jgi:hypothetical protein